MAIETKMLLQAHADYALATKNRGMYRFVCNQLNVEGITLKPYDEALKDFENDTDKPD